jgi:hypothetical protein
VNPKFLKWVFPIILEFFKSENRFKIYLKRNLTIAILFISMILSLCFNFYLFEQATVYGAAVKERDIKLVELKEKMSSCSKDREKNAALAATCG